MIFQQGRPIDNIVEGENIGVPKYQYSPIGNPIMAIIKAIQGGMGQQPPQIGTPGINPGAPDPRQSLPFPANLMAETMTKNIPQILTGQGQIPEWQNQRQDLMRQAYQPMDIKQRNPISGRDILPVGLAAILASLLGAQDEDLSQGLQGFMGARQDLVGQEYQQAMQNEQLRRQGIMQEAGFMGEKIDKAEKARSDNERFLRELSTLDKKHLQDKELEAIKADARKKDPFAQLHDNYMARIGNLPEGPEKSEAGMLFRKWVSGQATTDEVARLDQLAFQNTLKESGQATSNALKEVELKWANPKREIEYKTAVERLKQMGIVTQIRAKDLKNYDENQRTQRMMWYALFNQRQQNIDFNQAMNIYDAQNKRQLDAIKKHENYQEDLMKRKKDWWEKERKNKASAAFGVDLLPDEPPTDTKFDAEYNRIQGEIDRLSKELPASPPMGAGGLVPNGQPPPLQGNLGGNLPGILNEKTGQESGTTQRGAAGANAKVNTNAKTPKPTEKKDTRTPAQKAKDKLKQSGKWDT